MTSRCATAPWSALVLFSRTSLSSKPARSVIRAAPRAAAARVGGRDASDGSGGSDSSDSASGPFDAAWLWRQSLVVAAASAVLGPLCDGQHSAHDVLHYVAPVHLSLGPVQLETCWWVPLMFGLAGVILGVSHPILDAWAAQRGGAAPRGGADPSWSWVLAGIACFVLQYAASGALEGPLDRPGVLDALLATTAAAQWAVFDATPQGAFMAALTAVAGPAMEMSLINGLHLYSYQHNAWVLGTPSWICWVYACGGPAVGNLGRRVSAELQRQRMAGGGGDAAAAAAAGQRQRQQ